MSPSRNIGHQRNPCQLARRPPTQADRRQCLSPGSGLASADGPGVPHSSGRQDSLLWQYHVAAYPGRDGRKTGGPGMGSGDGAKSVAAPVPCLEADQSEWAWPGAWLRCPHRPGLSEGRALTTKAAVFARCSFGVPPGTDADQDLSQTAERGAGHHPMRVTSSPASFTSLTVSTPRQYPSILNPARCPSMAKRGKVVSSWSPRSGSSSTIDGSKT